MSYLLNSVSRGRGEPVILLHGLAGSARYWGSVTSLLKNQRTIAFDLLGFGQSPKPNRSSYSLNEHVDSIIYSLNQLGVKESATLVGFSTGGIVAAALAARYASRVKKLVLISTPVYETPAQAKQYILGALRLPEHLLYGPSAHLSCVVFCRALRPLTRQVLPHYLKGLPKVVAQDALLHTWKSYSKTRDNVLSQTNVGLDIANLSVPTQLIYGLKDKYVRQANIKTIAALNPKLKIIRLAGGHQLPLESPEPVARAIS